MSEGEDVAPNRAHQLQYFATIFRDCTLDSEMSAFRPFPGLIELLYPQSLPNPTSPATSGCLNTLTTILQESTCVSPYGSGPRHVSDEGYRLRAIKPMGSKGVGDADAPTRPLASTETASTVFITVDSCRFAR